MTSTWRMAARRVIEQALDRARSEGLDAPATLKMIDACYPFGPRENHPYHCWLLERREAIKREGLGGTQALGGYRCAFCRDAGCLVCAGVGAKGEQS